MRDSTPRGHEHPDPSSVPATPSTAPGQGRRGPAARALGAALVVTAVTGGLASCSLGNEEFNGNNPNATPSQGQLVRTPSPLGTQLPVTDPPLEVPLPGPTGGLPGEPNTTAPPASPGGDGGASGPAN